MADEVGREADALAALRDVTWVWHDSTAIDDAVAWFQEAGLGDLADDLVSYQGSPDHAGAADRAPAGRTRRRAGPGGVEGRRGGDHTSIGSDAEGRVPR